MCQAPHVGYAEYQLAEDEVLTYEVRGESRRKQPAVAANECTLHSLMQITQAEEKSRATR